MKDDFLTLMDAALEFRLGLARGRLYDLALAGRLGEVQRRGRQLFVSRAGVAAYQRSAISGEPIRASSGVEPRVKVRALTAVVAGPGQDLNPGDEAEVTVEVARRLTASGATDLVK